MQVNIYMKSGNVIPVFGVEDLHIKYSSHTGDITSLKLEYKDKQKGEYLMVPSIQLGQIEGITTLEK